MKSLKRIISALIIWIMANILVACGDNNKEVISTGKIIDVETSTIEREAGEETLLENFEIEPLEFKNEYGSNELCFIVKNKNEQCCYFRMKVLFYNSDDKVIHTEDNNGALMASNQTSLICIYNIYDLDYSRYEYEITEISENPSFMSSYTEDVLMEYESNTAKDLTVKFTNNSDVVMDEAYAKIIYYDAQDKPLAWGSVSISQSLNPGDSEIISTDILVSNISYAVLYANASASNDLEFPESKAVSNNVYRFDFTNSNDNSE